MIFFVEIQENWCFCKQLLLCMLQYLNYMWYVNN